MTSEKKEQIRAVWARIDRKDDDISTEQLAARVADECGVETYEVIAALEPSGGGR